MAKPRSPQAIARRRSAIAQSFAHLLLLVGCVLFGFPFYWLLSTSVKEQDELFAEPPIWVPRWPQQVEQSPYYAEDEYRMPKAPEGVLLANWRYQWPDIRDAAAGIAFGDRGDDTTPSGPLSGAAQGGSAATGGQRLRAGRPRSQRTTARDDAAAEALARGLWTVASPRFSPDELREAVYKAHRALPDLVTERDIKTVWDNVYRRLRLRDITVQDQGFVQYRLTQEAPAKLWRVTSGDARLVPALLGKEPAALVSYSFASARAFSLEADLPSPIKPEQFRRLTIPLQADRSWHRVDLEVDVGGRLFRSSEPLVLFSDLSQEAAWQIPDADRTGASAFRDYLPLRQVGQSKTASARVHVKLTFRRNSPLGVAYAKVRRNYRDAMNFVPLGTYFRNTLILVILNVLGQLFSCSVVAYAFARLRWPGRDVSFAILLSTMMLPAQVTMIPVFLIYRYLGWYGTLQPLWVGSLFGSAFFIFLLRQFMRTIPKDLEDAAKIDGCSFFGLYWRIILPLMKPALAAVAIFSFMNAWNEFMGPLIYLNDQRLYPLSLGLYQFRIEHAADYGMLMAASALMIIPVVVVFFLAQKHFIQGVQLTGMKQ